MMKKEIISIFLALVLIFTLFSLINNIQLISAESPQLISPDDPLNKLSPDKIDETKTTAEQKWDYLKNEWKTLLLKNKAVSLIDSALTKINIVFKTLFNKDYELLSASLWIIIVLWLFFSFAFGTIIKDFSTFSSGVSFIISAILTVILAHLNFLAVQANFFIWLASAAFGDSQPWWVTTLIWIGIFIVLITASMLINKFGAQIKAGREKMKLLQEQMDIATGAKSGKALTKAMS